MANEYTGTALYVKFGSTVLSSRYKSWEENVSTNLVETAAGSDTMRTYLSTLDEGATTLEILDQTGGTVLWAAVAPRTSGTLEWAPEGTASGKPKNVVLALVKSRKRAIVNDDVTKITVEFQHNSTSGVTASLY